MLRPFAVIGDGENDDLGQFVVPQDFQNLRFGEAGIVESDFENLCVARGDQGSGDARGAAAGKSNSLPQRQLRQARDDVLLGVALEFGGSRRRQRILNEVHQVEVAQKAQANHARGTGMKNQGALHGVAFQECFSPGDIFDNLRRQIFSREQQAEERIVERGIFEKGEKNLCRWVVEKRLQFFAGGESRAVALLFEKGQVRFLTQAARVAAPDVPPPKPNTWHMEKGYASRAVFGAALAGTVLKTLLRLTQRGLLS